MGPPRDASPLLAVTGRLGTRRNVSFLEVKDALVTNHKCGTCRFYEVGAQQTHGWCRNPAYPRRDDVALLRNDELACRIGWDTDFWVARDTAGGSETPSTRSNDETTQPIPVPIGTGIGERRTPTIAAALRPPAATGRPLRQDGAPGATNTVIVPARALTTAPKDGTMGTIKATPPLSGHPELNELGVPIRAPKRSSVAEAHRRAMERRAQERQTKEERDRLAAQEALQQADAARAQQLVASATPAPESRPLGGGLNDFSPSSLRSIKATTDTTPKGERAEPKRELARADGNGAKRELVRPEITPPSMPRPTAVVVPVSASDNHEPEDVIISTGEKITETLTPSTSATPFSTDTPAPPQRTIEIRNQDTVAETEAPLPTADTSRSGPSEAIQSPRQSRRWDQPGILKGLRMRPESARPESARTATPQRPPEAQTVRQVGRKEIIEPKPVSTRAIKQLGASLSSTPDGEEARAIAPPAPRPPKPVEARQAIVAPLPTPTEPAPRQIDESLLRQLENDWQAQQQEAYAGQRCGTCRFFQPSEMGRGTCNCPFAPVHRQQTEGEGLPCATALGIWWAAPDEGWLERTERRPRRATPLLDALLREREAMEPLHAAPPLRRGAR